MLTAATLRANPDAEFWLDLLAAEEVAEEAVLADLATAGVIYVGEAHTIARHHAVQTQVLMLLATRGVPLVLGLEQLEARDQAVIDRFNRGELDFDGLAREIGWAKKWKNFADYRPLCEAARARGVPLVGLNAPPEVIRAISRGGGLAKLPPEQRTALPVEIVTDDPTYERLLNLELAVHMAMDPAKLRPAIEAQMARDETMAVNIVAARRGAPGQPPRTVLAIVGGGHVRFGLGTPDRVRRREPGVVDRIVLVTESGQLRLSAEQRAAMREVSLGHGDLRPLARPPGDYLHVLPRAAVSPPPP
jgi:uncharacterized iron-regulated protein